MSLFLLFLELVKNVLNRRVFNGKRTSLTAGLEPYRILPPSLFAAASSI